MKAACLRLALLCPLAVAQQTAPAATATAFEVATVKVHPSGGTLSMVGFPESADGVNGEYVTLAMLVEYAYGLRAEDQVIGIPAWAKDLRFDVRAKMSEADTAALKQLDSSAQKKFRGQLMQTLLAERFHLATHLEPRQVPVYDLVVAKGGSKLKETTDSNPNVARDKEGKPLRGYLQFFGSTMTAQGYSMQLLANFLSQPYCQLGRPVVDKTRLTGAYDFTLPWSPNLKNVMPGSGVAAPSPEDTTSIFTALGDLGLRLQNATGSEDFIVIDHVERPTEN